MENKDPVNTIIEAIREEGKFYNEPSFFIGKIKSELPDIKVLLGDMPIDKRSLLIDKWLLDRNNYLKTESKGHFHGGDTSGDGSHYHDISKPIHNKLEVDDEVVMVRHGEKFIIISKVVAI